MAWRIMRDVSVTTYESRIDKLLKLVSTDRDLDIGHVVTTPRQQYSHAHGARRLWRLT